jgi:hypothetical protein
MKKSNLVVIYKNKFGYSNNLYIFALNKLNKKMEQSIKETIKANLSNLRKDCEMALSGEWDCTTQEGINTGFPAMIEVVDEIEKLVNGEKTKEMRVYVVNTHDERVEDIEDFHGLTDEEFMFEAEEQGRVYTIEGFQKAFNGSEVNTETDFIRFIEVEI